MRTSTLTGKLVWLSILLATSTEFRTNQKHFNCKIQKGKFVSKNYSTHKTGVISKGSLEGVTKKYLYNSKKLLLSFASMQYWNEWRTLLLNISDITKNKYLREYKAQIGFHIHCTWSLRPNTCKLGLIWSMPFNEYIVLTNIIEYLETPHV